MLISPIASAHDPARFGSKAARLAQTGAWGFSTCDGFCVGFGALDDLLARSLTGELRARLGDRDGAVARREAAAACAEAPLPADLAGELEDGIRRLAPDATTRLAVRSSAAAEDGVGHSFAGQFLTCLDVEPAGVERAMRQVWASLWSDTVVDYCNAFALRPPARMAVIVQPMVRACRLAIAHSIDSAAGRTDRVILDLSREGASDCYVVDRMSLEFLCVEPADGGAGFRIEELAAARDLARLVLAIERENGFAIDVEAAHDGRAWRVLQVRPVTGAAAVPA
jgi:phosphoenolpyruvate synthase/pyruvate phosphate dikinase